MGAVGPNKGLLSRHILLKEKRAKGSSTMKHTKGKRQPGKGKSSRFNRKNAYSRLQKM
jgi:hypothetical protein